MTIAALVGAVSLLGGLLAGLLWERRGGSSADRAAPPTSQPAPTTATTATTVPSTTVTTVPATTTTTGPTTTSTAARVYPDANSTGPAADVSLAPAEQKEGWWELDHDIEGIEYSGTIVPIAPNITIRNVRITVDNEVGGIFNRDGLPGIVVENVEVVCNGSEDKPGGAGVIGAAVVKGSDISGCADGIKVGTGAQVVGNYIHDLSFGAKTHNDGIQMQGGTDVLIEGNTIVQLDNGRKQANAAVFIQDTNKEIRRVTIRGNYVNGFGFTLRLNGDRIYDSAIVDNLIGPGHIWGPLLLDDGAEKPANGNTTSGNVNADGTLID